MKKLSILILAIFFFSFYSCRETEVNTDGDMEEREVEESAVISTEEDNNQ